MSWFESSFAAALPGAQLLLLVLGLPILVFGLVKLLVLPLSVWFEIRAATPAAAGSPHAARRMAQRVDHRARLQRGNRHRELRPIDPAHPV